MSTYLIGATSNKQFLEWLDHCPEIALDIETVEDIVIGIGLGTDEMAGYFTKEHVHLVLPHIVEIQSLWPIVMHNGGSDVRGLRKSFPGTPMIRVWDTMVAASLFNEPELNLEYLAWHVGSPILHESFKKLMKEYKAKDLEGVPEEIVAEYNLSQVIATWKLKQYYLPLIEENPNFPRVYDIEMQILPLLTQMEENGVLIDAPRLADLRERFDAEATAYQDVVTELTHGGITNVNSPKQVSEWIFEVLGHPVIYKTDSGAPSTEERVLKKIAAGKHGDEPRYKFLRPLLHTRQIRKLVGTYCDGLAASLDGDSRSHTQFSQVTADTGRLASREPNHQNIPKRRGPEIRRCFVAPPGSVLVAADMDQLELRIIAEEAQEPRMQDAFRSGRDIHQEVADELHLERFPAKILNYTIVYLAGAQQIADQIGVSKAKAEMWQNSYFRKYSTLVQWMKDYSALCEQRGYTETWLGRRRDVVDFFADAKKNYRGGTYRSGSGTGLGEGARKSVNTRIQGTAAEVMKLAMLRVENRLRELKLRSRQLIQIHDEILLEVPVGELEIVKLVLEEEMTTKHLTMPLPITIKVGLNWGDVH
jgi:DNA polymerase-1